MSLKRVFAFSLRILQREHDILIRGSLSDVRVRWRRWSSETASSWQGALWRTLSTQSDEEKGPPRTPDPEIERTRDQNLSETNYKTLVAKIASLGEGQKNGSCMSRSSDLLFIAYSSASRLAQGAQDDVREGQCFGASISWKGIVICVYFNRKWAR